MVSQEQHFTKSGYFQRLRIQRSHTDREAQDLADEAWESAERFFKDFRPEHTIYGTLLELLANHQTSLGGPSQAGGYSIWVEKNGKRRRQYINHTITETLPNGQPARLLDPTRQFETTSRNDIKDHPRYTSYLQKKREI